MKIRVGVIGPSDSIEQMIRVGQKCHDMEFIPFMYKETEDTSNIIKTYGHSIDQWFFSGPVPYEYAVRNQLIDENEGTYAMLHGSSLLGTLLHAMLDQNELIHSLSLDSIGEDQLSTNKNTSGLSAMKIYNYQETGYIPKQKLVDFHKGLYREGKTKVAITCIHSVYMKLKELNIPVYRVVPSELAIRLAIDYLLQRSHALSYRKRQFVIIGVEVCYPSAIDEGFIPYKIQYRELELTRVLLKFSEVINGSFVKVANGKYFIYTTRGELELYQQQHTMETLSNDIFLQSSLRTRIGIGFGRTVLEADEHVHIAFDYARKDSHFHIVLVTEESEVVELREQNDNVSFQQRLLYEKGAERFGNLKISPTQLSRIYALIKHYEKNKLTSQELATWLQSTERNARRILHELEKSGLALVIGEESGQRGRPRKVYKVKLPSVGFFRIPPM